MTKQTNALIESFTCFANDFEDGIGDAYGIEKALDFCYEEIKETKDAFCVKDFEEILDGFGDVAFVAVNGIYKSLRHLGYQHEAATTHTIDVLTRIANANLGKRQADGTVKKVNGKVVKPEGWSPPQYNDLLEQAEQKVEEVA